MDFEASNIYGLERIWPKALDTGKRCVSIDFPSYAITYELCHSWVRKNDSIVSMYIKLPPYFTKISFSATIIKKLEEHIVIYFYFDKRGNTDDKSGYRGLLLSLLLQVGCSGTGIHPLLHDLYKKCKQGVNQPQTRDLKDTLVNILQSMHINIFIVTDAMDECNEQHNVVSFLLTLPENCHIVITSRDSSPNPSMWLKLHVEEEQTDQDIKLYLEEKLDIGKLGVNLCQKVFDTLMDGAHGQ